MVTLFNTLLCQTVLGSDRLMSLVVASEGSGLYCPSTNNLVISNEKEPHSYLHLRNEMHSHHQCFRRRNVAGSDVSESFYVLVLGF